MRRFRELCFCSNIRLILFVGVMDMFWARVIVGAIFVGFRRFMILFNILFCEFMKIYVIKGSKRQDFYCFNLREKNSHFLIVSLVSIRNVLGATASMSKRRTINLSYKIKLAKIIRKFPPSFSKSDKSIGYLNIYE